MVIRRWRERIKQLPPSLKEEALDFVGYLLAKTAREREEWMSFSLQSAMRGMEDEEIPEYSLEDLKVVF